MEDAVIYPSGYHTNVGFFLACFTEQDILISDECNHASIIDGLRLTKSKRTVYRHMDLDHLESILKKSMHYRFRVIVTEGVFSMDGDVVPLQKIVDLKNKYKAVLFLDDCHGTAVIGKTGRGTPEYCNVSVSEIDALVSTMAKGFGGGMGGYTAGKSVLINYLKKRSRTFVFSNSLSPPIIGGALKCLEIFS